MLAGNRGLNLFQEAGVDQPEERRVLGPGRARRTRAKGRGGRERARDSGAVAALPESGASRFSSHGTSRETRRLAPEIFSLQKATEGESGADV